jgi:hypothetical protein
VKFFSIARVVTTVIVLCLYMAVSIRADRSLSSATETISATASVINPLGLSEAGDADSDVLRPLSGSEITGLHATLAGALRVQFPPDCSPLILVEADHRLVSRVSPTEVTLFEINPEKSREKASSVEYIRGDLLLSVIPPTCSECVLTLISPDN